VIQGKGGALIVLTALTAELRVGEVVGCAGEQGVIGVQVSGAAEGTPWPDELLQ
jgi:hypothetical protein